MQHVGPEHIPTGQGPKPPTFGIRDAMTMIAATAVGLAWTRSYVLDYLLPFRSARGALEQRYQLVWILLVVPMMTTWTVGLFTCQTRRLSVHQLTMRPGTVACGVVTLTSITMSLLALVVWVVTETVPGWRGRYGAFKGTPVSYLISWIATDAGLAVACTWLLMSLSRSSRPEPTFLDRLGRGLGWAWIVMFVLKDGYFLSLMM